MPMEEIKRIKALSAAASPDPVVLYGVPTVQSRSLQTLRGVAVAQGGPASKHIEHSLRSEGTFHWPKILRKI